MFLPGITKEPSVSVTAHKVIAEGTWVLDNEKLAYPLNVTKITCYKEISTCIEARAEIMSGGDSDSLLLNTYDFPITKWDNYEIIADAPGGCRKTS